MIGKTAEKKVRLFALIEPLNIRMSLCFPSDCLVADIHNFIDDVMRRYTIKYRVGRIEWNGAWILPQYKIEDFLEDKSEITVFSVEYGLTLKNLPGERDRIHVNYSVFDQDINSKFTAKKTNKDKKRKSAVTARTNEATDNIENDDDFTQPPVGIENVEEIDKDTRKNKNLIPPKEIQRKEKYDQGKDKKQSTQTVPPHPSKKRGDETPTRALSTQALADNLKKKNQKQTNYHEASSASEDEHERNDNKHHRNVKKLSRDENEESSAQDVEDISYPQKTNQPLDKRYSEKKLK